MRRDQELLALPVGVLSPHLLARNVGHEEHATRLEGNVLRDLGDRQGAPQVDVAAQRDERGAPGKLATLRGWLRGRRLHLDAT